MNCNIRLFMKCVGLIIAFTAGSVSCFSTPATARVMNHDVVAIQIEQKEETTNITSDLLNENGQIIYVNDGFEELVVPITIWGENSEGSGSIAAKIKAVSSDEKQLLVSLDKEQILFEEGKSIVQLSLKRLEIETEDNTETEEILGTEEPTQGNEELTPETEEESATEELTPETEEESATEEPAQETEEEPTTEIIPETETLLEDTPVIELSNEAMVNILPQIVIGTSATEVESENQDETEEQPETDTETVKKEESEEEKETLFSEISFTYGEKTYSATIVVVTQEEKEPVLGELSFCQSQYHPTKLITMIGGKESDCEISGFPAMTKYILENQAYMLYNGGSITIPAGKEIKVNLSETKVKEDLLLTAGSGKTYTIKYAELPKVSKDTFPTVISEEGAILTNSEKWGTIEPSIRIEHLTIIDDSLAWETVESITVEKNHEGDLQIMPNQAEAGTYRAVVLWNESEVTLEKMEISFFVQYASVDQGGIGQ